jgi:hypothetical protein
MTDRKIFVSIHRPGRRPQDPPRVVVTEISYDVWIKAAGRQGDIAAIVINSLIAECDELERFHGREG